MTRANFDRQIRQLQDEILLLGSMVEYAIVSSVDTLKRHDIKLAQEIIESDQKINEKRFAIENAVLILIATQQPIAHDLRVLAAMLEVINELERIGDYGKGIAKVTLKLKDEVLQIPVREFSRMAEIGVSMLHRSLSAFISENANLASAIPTEDNQVDDLYLSVTRILINSMIANPGSIDQLNLLMWVAHNLERAADRATNICERTVFIATGELLELDSSDDETSRDN